MVRKTLLFFFITMTSLPAFSQQKDVKVWGIYLDLTNPVARRAAKNLSETSWGYFIDTLTSPDHFVLVPGDINPFRKVLQKKKRDGILIRSQTYSGREGCLTGESLKDSLVQYQYMRRNLISQHKLQLPYHWPSRYDKASAGVVGEYTSSQEKKFRKFLRGKGNIRGMNDYSWALLGVPQTNRWESGELDFQFYKGGKEVATLRFDTLRAAYLDDFPLFSEEDCGAFNRFTLFSQLNGAETMMPTRYRPRSEAQFKRVYQLSFAKDRAEYNEQDIREIVNVLTDSSYSIVAATVEGYASVEGTYENNVRLQNRRARVLINVLQKYNDQIIDLDTVITTENWALFSKQIADGSFAWMDSLSHEEVKNWLKKDSVEQILEPLLAQQRKAILTLTLNQKFSDAERVEATFRDLGNVKNLICEGRFNISDEKVRARMMGLIDYVERLVSEGKISREAALENINESALMKEVFFYQAAANFNKYKKLPQLLSLEEIITDAQAEFVAAYTGAISSGRNRSVGCLLSIAELHTRLSDVLLFTIQLIRAQELPPTFLCRLKYPRTHYFYPFVLNALHFINNAPIYPPAFAECFSPAEASLSFINETDPWPPYYFLIRKLVFEKDASILSYVYRSDNLFEFDLYEFLKINIDGWDEKNDDYYDPGVDMDIMRKQLSRLYKIRKRVCTGQVDALAIKFYVKSINVYLEKGLRDIQEQNKLNIAFSFLKRYYLTRADQLNDAQAYGLARHFLLLNDLTFPETARRRPIIY